MHAGYQFLLNLTVTFSPTTSACGSAGVMNFRFMVYLVPFHLSSVSQVTGILSFKDI